MRIFTLLFLLFPLSLRAQPASNTYTFSFEYTPTGYYLFDPGYGSHWQIGKPQKTVLISAYSPMQVIITDTVAAYPPSDTSRFTIHHVSGCTLCFAHWRTLSGYYYCDSDTLNDFGAIEFSHDNGNTWINLLTDTICSAEGCYQWMTQKPILSGRSGGWKHFMVRTQGFWINHSIQQNDTVLYRFSFLSDATHSGRDGLMFDDLSIHDDIACSVKNNALKTVRSRCYPSPAKDQLTIEFKNPLNYCFSLGISDESGKPVFSKADIFSDRITLNISALKNGLYFYSLTSLESGREASGKFIISK